MFYEILPLSEMKNLFPPLSRLNALAGYDYLVNVMGDSPSNLIIVCHSASGNPTCALTQYLVENKNTPNVPLPVAPEHLILLSLGRPNYFTQWTGIFHHFQHRGLPGIPRQRSELISRTM
ncbi:hypothetical protein JVU11DRAFT_2408 [Chiua virens]|nr:hypothetical protein JVU11DRAFT_2408 [Chiua virens]